MPDFREHGADEKGGRNDGDEKKRGFEALEKNGSLPLPEPMTSPRLDRTGTIRSWEPRVKTASVRQAPSLRRACANRPRYREEAKDLERGSRLRFAPRALPDKGSRLSP